MKKIFTLALAAFALAVSCQKPTPEPDVFPPLQADYSSTLLAAGETLTLDITVIPDDSAEKHKDIVIAVDAFEGGKPTSVFTETFPTQITVPAGEMSKKVTFTVQSDLEGAHDVTFMLAAENYSIKGGRQAIQVVDAFKVSFSVAESEKMEFTEGGELQLKATLQKASTSAFSIVLTAEPEVLANFESFPASFEIPAGQTEVVFPPFAVKVDDGDFYDDQPCEFVGETTLAKFAVVPFTLTRLDKDTDFGDKLNDEHWVYANPETPFHSKNTVDKWPACPSAQGTLMAVGDAHPTASIAAEGWTLAGAYEFHAIDGWSFPRGNLAGGIHPVLVANGWGEQATKAVEATFAVSNSKYTHVSDEGILRMWAAHVAGNAQTGGARDYTGAALYANKSINTSMQNTVSIVEGTRVEVRARVRGAVKGFNYAVWLMGNSNNDTVDWPQCGEIDIMENPVFIDDVDNAKQTVHQTLHWGKEIEGVGHNNPTKSRKLEHVEEFNIYWVEIVDATTVRMGINGQLTREFKASDYENASEWPFCKAQNPKGFALLLTPGLADKWTGADPTTTSWADPAFLNLSYQDSITSDDAPRMEVDWIRVWKNENYDASKAPVNAQAKMF